MRVVATLLTGAALSVVSMASAAENKGAHYVILPDASASNLMVTDATHARRVAKDMARIIGEFRMRDRITISPLGEFKENPIIEEEVNRYFPPERAMRDVTAMIANFPNAVNTELGGPAPVTHIQGALQLAASRVNCAEPTIVLVLTDGRETGDALRPQPLYQGCAAMVMIGVIGETPLETSAIVQAWKGWCSAAGFIRCEIIN